MANVPAPDARSAVERTLENGLFLSCWLMAPFYVGLVVALGMLLRGRARPAPSKLVLVREKRPAARATGSHSPGSTASLGSLPATC